MRKLQERRVLKGWYLGVSPGLTGHDLGSVWLRTEESEKAGVIEDLLSATEVERVCSYFGPKLSFLFYIEKKADPATATKRLKASIRSNVILFREGVVSIPPYDIGPTDLSIIGILQEDPWKPYPNVAEEVRVSTKTLARRVARLSENGAIYMLPDIDLKALQGVIPVELVVEYESQRVKASANRLLATHIEQELIFSDTSGPVGYFALVVPNLSQMEHLTSWASRQEGVKDARVDALQDVVLNRNHYEEWRIPDGLPRMTPPTPTSTANS